jgi:hypothetical protein
MTKETLTIKILKQHVENYMIFRNLSLGEINLGTQENPFPIGRTNIQKLLIHGTCSLKNQAELAQFFGFIPILNLIEK